MLQASHEQDKALFRAQMEEEGQFLRSELADVQANLEKERNAARTANALSEEAMLKTETQVHILEDNLSGEALSDLVSRVCAQLWLIHVASISKQSCC
jgi:hypothetical protein